MTAEEYTQEVERLLDEANLFASALCFYDEDNNSISAEFIHNGHFFTFEVNTVSSRIKLKTSPKDTAKGLAYKALQTVFDELEEEHV